MTASNLPPQPGSAKSAAKIGKAFGVTMAAVAVARGLLEGLSERIRPLRFQGRPALPPAPVQSPARPVPETRPWHHSEVFWSLLKDAGSEWLNDKASRLGAALAYYAVFSLAPFLVIVVALAGRIFGEDAARGRLSRELESMVGPEGGKALEAMIASADQPITASLATVLGVIMLLVGAAGLFGQLQDALNTVWEVQPKSGRGILGFIKDRFLSFTMVLGTAFLLLISLAVSAALSGLASYLGSWGVSIWGQALNVVLSMSVTTVLFAMIYRYLPDAKIAWRDVWLGAGLTAILFTLGKFLIGLYIGSSSVGSAYGAAGSLAVLLIWLYYSSQIFLFGAELTKVFANRYGSHIVPTENAEPVTQEARAHQGMPVTAS